MRIHCIAVFVRIVLTFEIFVHYSATSATYMHNFYSLLSTHLILPIPNMNLKARPFILQMNQLSEFDYFDVSQVGWQRPK